MKTKTTMKFATRLTQLAVVLAGAFATTMIAQSAVTDIYNEPLAQAAANIKPNLMYILDDSGSMAWDYTPDWIPGTNCLDAKDSGGSISGGYNNCEIGDPPYMSPDMNTQYYNPEIYYRPGANYDGTDRTAQTSANTSGWTSVRTDSYNVQNKNQLGNTTNYADLINSYPDRVWCDSTATPASDTTNCKRNAAYSYPSTSFGYGKDTGGNTKYLYGEPYYYRIDIFEICSDLELTSCIAGTTPTTARPYAARVRWCDSTSYTNCQRKRLGSFTNAKFLGATSSGAIVAKASSGTTTIGATANNNAVSITSVKVNNVTITNATITASGGTNDTGEADSMATALAANINTFVSSPDYTATVLDNVVTITAASTGVVPNGFAIQVFDTATGTTAASVSFSVISGLSTSGTGSWLQNIKVNPGNTTIANNVFCDLADNSGNRRICAYNIATAINAGTGTHGYTATPTTNNSTTTVTISATVAAGSGANGRTLTIANGTSGGGTGGAMPLSTTTGTFSGGVSAGFVPVTIANMSGGADAFTGLIRTGVGSFTRTNIISTITSYPKTALRVDCAGVSSCTYAEEMANFANWYTYYRTRMQMMKSAAGRAFVPIDDTYRVGFITINPGYPVNSSRYLKISDFTPGAGGQKDLWYAKFYGTGFNGGTPLREALSRVGQIYAGKFTTNSAGTSISGAPNYLTKGIPNTDDPVQQSCQPNFAILSTDGYWTTANSAFDGNDNHGWKENMTAMDNQDNVNSGWSKRSDGVYDGNRNSTVAGSSSGSSGTLADVAQYYYKTDLRPAGSLNAAGVDVSTDNVPQSQKDLATHQHMATFTLGLGLDGNLTYRSDYDDPSLTSGDFYRIKTGVATCASNGGGTGTTTCDWPSVTGDSATALDDLWHAAVNGRGLFFSAKNPEELAQSLGDTLTAMRARVGAGAAAATSALQPIASDNYAFTAQYQTQTWTGDISARTIDPASAIVSTASLWTAATLLDARAHTSRVLFTSDLGDTVASAAVGSGNKLRHLCWPSGTPIANCADGDGLTVSEQAYFAPTQLGQYTSWLQLKKNAATAQQVVNFVRGDNTNETTDGVAATDLYRNRASILGDIINAQPAFIKASSFTYGDPGYTAFKACTAGTGSGCPTAQFPTPTAPRRATVYIASNDGFLHAFEVDANSNPYYQTAGISTATTTDDTFTGNNAGNGEERWAFTPNLVLPNLYKLANDPYAHRYSTDGSPVIADVCTSTPCAGLNDWRTILVAGLNSGGRGYYALDVTYPLGPKALWEFGIGDSTCRTSANITANPGVYTSDCHIGLTYGNPIVTKRKSDGRWIVIVSSGYNNVSPGDGKGYLYVLDAINGTILHRIGTGVGCDGVSTTSPCTAGAAGTDPSGLGRLNAYIENSLVDNTTLTVYGGDLKGNVWRFDLDNANTSTYLTAFKLTTLVDSSGVSQPITVKPELGTAYNYRVIMLGTGQFLGTSDKASTQTQTIYALRDDLSATPISGRSQLTSQTLSAIASGVRTVTTTAAVDWSTKKGWYIDLPVSAERVNVDPQLQKGTLIVASNVPNTEVCSAGGFGLLNFLDYKSGQAIATSAGGVATYQYTGGLIVGVNYAITTGGDSKAIVTGSDTNLRTFDAPTATSIFTGNRISWRELIYDR